MGIFGREYYADIESRLRTVLVTVADLLLPGTVRLVGEMLDHNELGIALELMVEGLAEANAHAGPAAVTDLSDLARQMQMDIDVKSLLTP